MGRIGLEKLLAHLRDVFGHGTNVYTVTGEAALLIHDTPNKCDHPVLLTGKNILDSIAAQRGIDLIETTHEVYGKVHSVQFANVLIISPKRLPDYHTTEDIGPFKVETLSTVIMSLLVTDMDKNKELLERCFDNGGVLRLEAWSSDLESIENHYSTYPEYFEILEDPDGSQVIWKTLNGIEVAKNDHIFLEYVGMMYIETN